MSRTVDSLPLPMRFVSVRLYGKHAIIINSALTGVARRRAIRDATKAREGVVCG